MILNSVKVAEWSFSAIGSPYVCADFFKLIKDAEWHLLGKSCSLD